MQAGVLSTRRPPYDLGSMNSTMYHDYFKHQAINHPALAHTDDNRVFEEIGVDEDYGDYRTKVKGKDYVMRLIEYTYQPGQDQGGYFRKVMRGAFMVAKFYSARNNTSTEYRAAKAAAERVMDDLIEKMVADSRNGHPLFGYRMDSNQDFQVAPVNRVGDGAYVGWEVVFTLTPLFPELCGTVAWGDDGLTPIALVEDNSNFALIDDGNNFLG